MSIHQRIWNFLILLAVVALAACASGPQMRAEQQDVQRQNKPTVAHRTTQQPDRQAFLQVEQAERKALYRSTRSLAP